MGNTWTHAMCESCWFYRHPLEEPVRVRHREEALCCFCPNVTTSGIFVREDPRRVSCGGVAGIHEENEDDA